MRRPASSTLFPYTTLFRSRPHPAPLARLQRDFSYNASASKIVTVRPWTRTMPSSASARSRRLRLLDADALYEKSRSEEHTSELQSRENLVCRLLLEKKKNN